MPRTAWPMRCSFSTSAKRTNPSPPGPKPTPGEIATPASGTSILANSRLPISSYGSGIGAQTNIVPRGRSISHPQRARPSISASRRPR